MGVLGKIKSAMEKLPVIKQFRTLYREIQFIHDVLALDYLQHHLYSNPKYLDSKRLNAAEFQAFSQNGEDGLIAEIFRRIGVTNKFFVEFGVGNGLENNSAFLLVQGWRGAWLEADAKFNREIRQSFAGVLESGQLQLRQSFIDRDNIEPLFRELSVPDEFDFLSIDIDGNDYWVWQAITHYRPRVVMIEYNSVFGPSVPWIMEYNAAHCWDLGSYQGASLKSLETLGVEKGYSLVGCNFTGSNACFVLSDLVGSLFEEPFTSENHFEPPKYYGLSRRGGNKRQFGRFTVSGHSPPGP